MTTTKVKTIALGTSDFAEMIRENCLFIDKSLFIKAVIDDNNKVILITRPRRWGKTLNLSMLEHFFAETVNGQKTAGLFDHLAIAQAEGGQYLTDYQGQFPVIFLSFKDAKANNLAAAELAIFAEISRVYAKHEYLLKSDKLSDHTKKLVEYLINWCAGLHSAQLTKAQERLHFGQALKTLSEALCQHFGQKVYILIDEYDTPLNSAYEHGYLDELSDFMRNLLSAGLKDNSALQKGVLTGILRVPKNSMLSGLNNLKCFNLLHKKFSSYFGFTDAEVEQVFASQGLSLQLEQVKAWYNGYNFGGQTLYNPWSILNCADERKELGPYWILTGGDGLIRKALLEGKNDLKERFYDLLREGGTITANVSENITYEELWQEGYLWALLLYAGYLTAVSIDPVYSECQLRVPNLEVRYFYQHIFKGWLERTLGAAHYQALLQGLLSGDVEKFAQTLGEYLLQAMSAHDFYRESEYHTFVLGLISAVRETHYVYSNREYGIGRPDCVLVPKDPTNARAIVLEFKAALLPLVGKKRQPSVAASQRQAKQLAAQALEQIVLRGYGAALAQYPYVKTVLQVGVSFCQRAVAVASQITQLTC